MDHDEQALPIGTVLVDEYRIDGILGAGGFGITYRARDVKLDVDVAIKEYFPRDFASRSRTVTVGPRSKTDVDPFNWGLSQFIEEARRLARLQHPNIVRCMRYFEANDTGYFVMTFEEGRTLEKYFARPPQQSELDVLLNPLLNALEALHAAGIYHRDISPDNILVRDDDSPVLIDFGASRQAMARRTQTVAAIVKPGFSPIEQYDRETGQQGAWSDIYALGATIYSVIAGGPPPDALSRVRNDSYVPAREAARGAYRSDFLDAIDWALQPDPDDRPVTIREWRRKLLPNTSGARGVTAMTKFEPAVGNAKAFATNLLGKGKGSKGQGGKSPDGGGLRWPDYVLRGAALVMLGVFLVRSFSSKDDDPVKNLTSPLPVAINDSAERNLPILASDGEKVWSKVELVLRRLGHVRGGGRATLSEIRTGLKSYQHAIGWPETGVLNQELLNRVLDESIELDPYSVPGSTVYGRWFLEHTDEFCRVTSGATRIEGRSLATERPTLRIRADRSTTDASIDVAFTRPELFDTGKPMSLSGDGPHYMLKTDGKDVFMDNDARDPLRMMRAHKGEVSVYGTSALGGTLRISFSSDGFEEAFRALGAECGDRFLYWIDNWGAVAKDSGATVWHAVGYGTEDDAKAAALERCKSKTESGDCKDYTSFREQCWAITTGEIRKDDWAEGTGTDASIDTAKSLALDDCAKNGGRNCEMVMHICSDGSNEWHSTDEQQ